MHGMEALAQIRTAAVPIRVVVSSLAAVFDHVLRNPSYVRPCVVFIAFQVKITISLHGTTLPIFLAVNAAWFFAFYCVV